MSLVSRYFVNYYSNGIIKLIINTKEKWLYYYQYNDHEYLIEEYSEEEGAKETLRIPEDVLKFKEDTSYIPFHLQEKDQIYYVFIPRNMFLKPELTLFSDR